jgi:hypothetical protein
MKQIDRLVIETKFDAGDDGSASKAWRGAWSPDRIGDEIAKGSFRWTPNCLSRCYSATTRTTLSASWTEAVEDSEGLRIKGRPPRQRSSARPRGSRTGEIRRGARHLDRD